MLVWGTIAYGAGVDDVPNPRPRGEWVADVAQVVDASDEQALNAELNALERDLGVEVAVVTLSEVDGTPKDFATSLFARWGIGKAQADNGVLVLLVTGTERDVEIEPGYGLEGLLTDAWLYRMEDEQMVPPFQAGQFGKGLVAGVSAIDQQLRAHPDEARTGGRVAAPVPSALTWVAGGTGGLAGLLALGVLGRAVSRRKRTCATCGVYMPMLDEQADDAHLDEGQRAEERVGSVDYRVHQCPKCGDIRTFEVHRWFSGYDRCPQCRYRTRKTSRETIVAATHTHGGRVRVTERCVNCSYQSTYERATPRLSDSSSSSGSGFHGGRGGGSFGGGHSGGGGAGHHF